MKWPRRVGAAVFFWLVAASAAMAQFTQQGPKLIPPDVVISPFAGEGAGVGTNAALSADGNTLLLGAPHDGVFGAAFIYTRTSGAWSEQTKRLFLPSGGLNLNPGASVALSADGNTAAIGANEDNFDRGAVFVLTRSGTTWSEQVRINGTALNGRIGSSVALSADGNTLVAAGTFETFVFVRSGGTWTQQSTALTGSDASEDTNDRTVAVSGDGNTLIYGQQGDNGSVGAAFIFTRSGGVWTQQGPKLVGAGVVGGPRQGARVALSSDGNVAAIAGPTDNSARGAIWLFERSGGVWTQQGSKLAAANPSTFYGRSMSLSGDGRQLLIGSTAGTAHFRRCGAGWSQVGANLNSFRTDGLALSRDGLTAVIGNVDDNFLFLPEIPAIGATGAVWVFTQPVSQSFTVCSAADIASAGFPGGPFAPAQFEYVMHNAGAATNYSIVGVPDWLDVSSTSGTIGTDEDITVSFTVNAAAATKPIGAYNATISFLNATGFGDTSRNATLTVNPPQLIVSSSSNIAVSGNVGGAFTPASFNYALSASAGTVAYSITGVPSWLTASSTSGSVGTAGTTITFTVNANANSLAVGTYGPDTITFNDLSFGVGTTTRTATLTVRQPSLSVAAASNITATGAVGGPFAPGSFQYTLTAASADVPYTITGIPSWLTASSTSGSVSTASPTTITFTVNASANALAEGIYGPTTITFTNTATGLGNTTRTATLTTERKPSMTVLTSSNRASQARQMVSLTATVSGTGTPTGTVRFKKGSTTLATRTLANGQATFATDALKPGRHRIVATYSGSPTFNRSNSSTLRQDVNPHLGPEFAINTTTAGSQQRPAIARLAGDGFAAVWTSSATGNTAPNIFAQRYRQTGARVGGEFRTNGSAVKKLTRPAVTGLTDGGFVAIWQSDGPGAAGRVVGQRFNKNGAKAGGEIEIGLASSERSAEPAVAGLAKGGFVAVWHRDEADGIVARRFNARGAPTGSDIAITPKGTRNSTQPAIAALGDGGFVVAWQEGPASSRTIVGQRMTANGATEGAPIRFGGTGIRSAPVLAGLSDGGFVAVWQAEPGDASGLGIFAERYGSNGARRTPAFRVNTMQTNDQWQPSVSGFANGGFVVTWTSTGQDGSGYGVFAQAYAEDASPVLAEFRVNTTAAQNQWQPAIAAFTSGQFVAVWTSRNQDGALEGVFGQRFDLMGLTEAD